jgi:hypothetical protein
LNKKIRLQEIAYARSGDKGSSSNVGVIFINKQIYKWAVDNLTDDMVGTYFKGIALGGVNRYLMKNINAINFILKDSLDGGGSESLLNDAQGKTHGQAILRMEVELPEELLGNNE